MFDLPDLGPHLTDWLATLPGRDVLLVPGGGPTADVIRTFDRCFGLGEEKAHWLALRALTLNAHVLTDLLLGTRVLATLNEWSSGAAILDAHGFCKADDVLPHTWAVTSDAVAARVAIVARARRLVLLKSVTIPADMTWHDAARHGYVDALFPALVQAAPRLEVQSINFRAIRAEPGRPGRGPSLP